ncbi:MAG TPA: ATP-dependent chaperone ClpB, partial [Deltaproteobacteria bacterium]|nr:ATP-dependent chaperone ClpB [Deltaproteobacteria bacterium]
NRIDEQIVFRRLASGDVRTVLDRQLAALEEDLQARSGITLVVEPEAREWLAEEGNSPEYGIRELGRAIDRWIRGPVSERIAAGKLEPGGRPVVARKGPEGIVLE